MLNPQISPRPPLFMERSLNVPPQAPKPHSPRDAHFFIYLLFSCVVWPETFTALIFQVVPFFWPSQDFFPKTQQPAKYVWVWIIFCSYHKYPLCMAPDVMKWWMRSSLAFPKSRSGFLLHSDPKQIVGMSWALLSSLTQPLFELLNSFINLSAISKTGEVRKWWTTLRKRGEKPIWGYLMPKFPSQLLQFVGSQSKKHLEISL